MPKRVERDRCENTIFDRLLFVHKNQSQESFRHAKFTEDINE